MENVIPTARENIMTSPKVTILIPHYKTLTLTKLCLRLIRQYTDLTLARVIVIDNGSQDESTQYLKTLSWITLIERDIRNDPTPSMSHAKALDDALAQVTTPYVLSIHTDTVVKRHDWLPFLISEIEKNPNIAGVGSWKLEQKPLYKRILKTLETAWQSFYFYLTSKKNHAIEGKGDNYYYLRSHCALYRMDLIHKYHLHFADQQETAGKVMHKKLIDHGHQMIFLPSERLIKYADHLNHATMVLNPELGARNKTIQKGLKRIEIALKQLNAEKILMDRSLDI